MDKVVEMMSDIRKLKPYVPTLSKNKLFTRITYFVIFAAILSISVVIIMLWDLYISQLPNYFKLLSCRIMIAVDSLAIVFLSIFLLYSIMSFICKLRKGKEISYFSEEALLHDLEYIKDLDKKYKEDTLQQGLEWINSVINYYKERIKIFVASFSISSLIVVASPFNNPFVKTELKNWGLPSLLTDNRMIVAYVVIPLLAFAVGTGLGAFTLKIKMLEYKYKIAIIEMAISRKTKKEKQTYFAQKS